MTSETTVSGVSYSPAIQEMSLKPSIVVTGELTIAPVPGDGYRPRDIDTIEERRSAKTRDSVHSESLPVPSLEDRVPRGFRSRYPRCEDPTIKH